MFISPAFAQANSYFESIVQLLLSILIVGLIVGGLVALVVWQRKRGPSEWQPGRRQQEQQDANERKLAYDRLFISQPQVIIRTYSGDQAEATTLFQADSVEMAARGYFPTSQSYAPGQWGCGAFIVALLLCLIL